MDTLRTFLIGALVGAPLLAYGLSFLEGKLSRRALLTAVQLAVAAVLLSVIGLFFSPPLGSIPIEEVLVTSEELQMMTWLRMPGFEVTLGGRLDGFSSVQMTLVSVVLLLVLSAWPTEVSLRWLMLAWFGTTLVIMAGNLGQMFVGWTLSAWASSELARKPGNNLRPVWLVQRVSDVVMLAGFGIVWMHFDSSLAFAAWTPEAIGTLRPELIESIALCVLIGVIGRCAQLPLTVWLETEAGFAAQTGNSMTKLSDVMVGVWNVPDGHQVAERLKSDPANRWHESHADSIPPAVLAWWLCAAFLPVGIGLLVRFEPLFAVAPHTRLLMVAVGAFTLLMCSANAAAQMNWARVLSQFAAGQCGLVLVVMGIGSHRECLLGVSAFLWQSVMIAVFLVANQTIRRQAARLIFVALAFLAAGLCGRHAVAESVWEHARRLFDIPITASKESDQVVLGTTEVRLWLLVVGTIFLSEFLAGFTLFRAWFLSRREAVPRSEVSAYLPARIVLRSITMLVMFGCLWLRVDGERWTTYSPVTPSLMFAIGPFLPLTLSGAVLAWWMYSKPSSLPEKFSAAMGPFARLSRNRFYWDDLYFLLIVQPAVVFGEWLRWFDERVLGSGARALRSRLLRSLGESAEPLVAGSAMIGALTTLSSVAVLAWMLLWLKS